MWSYHNKTVLTKLSKVTKNLFQQNLLLLADLGLILALGKPSRTNSAVFSIIVKKYRLDYIAIKIEIHSVLNVNVGPSCWATVFWKPRWNLWCRKSLIFLNCNTVLLWDCWTMKATWFKTNFSSHLVFDFFFNFISLSQPWPTQSVVLNFFLVFCLGLHLWCSFVLFSRSFVMDCTQLQV